MSARRGRLPRSSTSALDRTPSTPTRARPSPSLPNPPLIRPSTHPHDRQIMGVVMIPLRRLTVEPHWMDPRQQKQPSPNISGPRKRRFFLMMLNCKNLPPSLKGTAVNVPTTTTCRGQDLPVPKSSVVGVLVYRLRNATAHRPLSSPSSLPEMQGIRLHIQHARMSKCPVLCT